MKMAEKILLTLTVAMAAGCAQIARPINENFVFREDSWTASQKHANMQAAVTADEEFSSIRTRSLEVYAGAGPQELRFRRVTLIVAHSEGGKPFLGFKGHMHFEAIVPDGMPMLKLGDLVEVRVGKVYDHLKGFAQTGEGTAVLRLLCPGNLTRAEGPAVYKCAKNLAWFEPWGEDKRYFDGIIASTSGRPYLSSLKEHTELTFSPYYNETGTLLASAVTPLDHQNINNWPTPKRY